MRRASCSVLMSPLWNFEFSVSKFEISNSKIPKNGTEKRYELDNNMLGTALEVEANEDISSAHHGR